MKSTTVTKLLSFIAFVIIVIAPLHADAANFQCTTAPAVSSSGTVLNATITVNQVGTISFTQANIDIAPSATTSSTLQVPTNSYAGTSSQQMVYFFNNLSPNTNYKVEAIYPNGSTMSSEEVTSCAFVSLSTPVITTPSSTATTTPSVAAAVPVAGVQTTSSTIATSQVPSIATTGIVSPDGDGLIPCDGDDCTVGSVIQLLDNLMTFFFQTLLLPIFVAMVMYLGVSYLTAQGKPGQHAKVLSMAKHMVGGLVLILCAWLIVHTILTIIGYTDPFGFFG